MFSAPIVRSKMRSARGNEPDVMPGDLGKIAARQDHQHVDAPQVHVVLADALQRADAVDDLIDLRQSLEVRIQAVAKQRIEHVAEDLAERRAERRQRRLRPVLVARTDDEQALGARGGSRR